MFFGLLEQLKDSFADDAPGIGNVDFDYRFRFTAAGVMAVSTIGAEAVIGSRAASEGGYGQLLFTGTAVFHSVWWLGIRWSSGAEWDHWSTPAWFTALCESIGASTIFAEVRQWS